MPENQARYMHGYHSSVLASHQWRTAENSADYLLPYLNSNQCLLDVGSGAGTITCDFQKLVKKVTALELNQDALDVTMAEAKRRDVHLQGAIGDIHSLPFGDNSFDVVHAHQVLQHVGDPVQALKEMWRVVKPGGIVAAQDSDFESYTWYPSDPMLDEWRNIYLQIARSNKGEPNAGRRLLDWAQQAGFTQITPGATSWCFATPDSREYWGGMWEKRILQSKINEQARNELNVPESKLKDISDAWGRWKAAKSGWFMVPHGNIIAVKST
ncbi:hypothetical protein MPSI1_003696 [Malassezia psittaci]|uniref:Methyltransferase type 11 domain-containing protein n=1 Tax=Malassezia psittaci TaxID=1821823 RepID=A0AAF0FCS2_9BASI|nr:hypothetical protein MPSI1_003696 [Malassezia psittaci]